MAYDRRSFAGAAAATTLDGGINGSTLTINIASSTGWPSGSNGEFFAVIDRGEATEEKVRIASRSSEVLTCTADGRGADGTSGTAHSSGATVELCITAVDLDEANAHIADTALDHHTQYLNTTRHDVEARHTFGNALGTPATPASIASANATGTGDNPAREDHVHTIGAGIVTAAMQSAEEWTAWTPTYGSVTTTGATIVAKSIKRGRDVTLRFSFVHSASSAFTGSVTVLLPYAASASGYQVGSAIAYDNSTQNFYSGSCYITPGGTTMAFNMGSVNLVDDVSPFTWAEDDILVAQITYEAAA